MRQSDITPVLAVDVLLLFAAVCCSADELRAALTPLVSELWQRLQHDASEHARLPVKLSLGWRCGYDKQQSKVTQVPTTILKQMRHLLLSPDGQQGTVHGDSSSNNSNFPGFRASGCPATGVILGVGQGLQDGLAWSWAGMTPVNIAQQQPLQQGPSTAGSVDGIAAVNAVCTALVQAYLEVLVAAVTGSRSTSTLKGQQKLIPQHGGKDGTGKGRVDLTAGSPGQRLNITRVSVGVVFADGS